MSRAILITIVTLLSCLLLFAASNVIAQDACEGNFDCDQDVDGTDAAVFKEDFGRSAFKNPCPDCQETPCPYNMVDCGTKCVDPLTDREYCGADTNCLGGTVCEAGVICDSGFCVITCSPGLTQCSGTCVDTDTDEDNCGGCGNVCDSGELCVSGTCDINCPPLEVTLALSAGPDSVAVIFNNQLNCATLMPGGAQFSIDNDLSVVNAVCDVNVINIQTGLQIGIIYTVTVESSILDQCGNSTDGTFTTVQFLGFQ